MDEMGKKQWGFPLLAAALWGLVYTACVTASLWTAGATLWAGIGTAVVIPHAVCAGAATLWGVLGAVTGRRWLILGSAGGWCAAAALFPPLHVFVLAPLLLTAGWLLACPRIGDSAACGAR